LARDSRLMIDLHVDCKELFLRILSIILWLKQKHQWCNQTL
jgi:hypothetical protein